MILVVHFLQKNTTGYSPPKLFIFAVVKGWYREEFRCLAVMAMA